jgi:CRP/FNR family cyclic AMP-dependent transcriptional regulator
LTSKKISAISFPTTARNGWPGFLLKLARFGQHDTTPAANMPPMSHETLAEMVGTTRSRITHFMNKFRGLGLIDYNTEKITVRAELLTDVVLHD